MKRSIFLFIVALGNCLWLSAQQQPIIITKAPKNIYEVLKKKANEKGMTDMNDVGLERNTGYYLQKKNYAYTDNLDAVFMSKAKNVPIAVYGAIVRKYFELGATESELGYPTQDELPMKDGFYQFFERGAIYWSGKTGAHVVKGRILQRYMNENYANGFLGFPTDDLKITPDKQASYCYFEGGAIYYHPKYGAFVIAGNILSQWGKEQFERGSLGYPIAEAQPIKGMNKTWQQYFEGGALVDVSGVRTEIVPGDKNGAKNSPANSANIFQKYKSMGGANSYLGVPVEKPIHGQSVWLQQFKYGYIYRRDNDIFGYTIHKGPIWDEFAKRRWEQGCGYVTDEEVDKPDVTYQVFSKGTIYYIKSQKTAVWKEGDNGRWKP
ncbi:LGFP repeat-containing protein [Ferruginibacter sp. HRS2-29]|uniref:LGFP repeat-containing protein n=1 Tax=Ferruginibacter sp. HRS2-29 TaxID=2487334 RepID=UPI0020CF04D0|nr:hypothetical protein [Ferruginibacter sp. HRS2-29]MCP9753522.1 hypothetical protein [Ferruginibacter sp. HRS2-29]